jgi:hypothetical protein
MLAEGLGQQNTACPCLLVEPIHHLAFDAIFIHFFLPSSEPHLNLNFSLFVAYSLGLDLQS